jgi:hypothetical protein
MTGGAAWDAIVSFFAPAFTQPSFVLFTELLCGWVLCPGRRTVTGMIALTDTPGRRAHDAYHRFLRAGAWTMQQLWDLLAAMLVSLLVPPGVALQFDLDDTLFHKTGRKVDGAGVYRDAVRSTATKVAYALGLNLVILTLRIVPPWGGEPLGLPINVRLYRKGGPSHLDLAEEMIREVAAWFPDRHFRLAADGAYAALAGGDLPRTHLTSRMRRDAALYLLPPPRKPGQRGRPRKKGRRLPTPAEIAARRKTGWVRAIVDERGKSIERLLYRLPVLWYQVCPTRLVLLVIVRDPTGKQRDDFFFTTDVDAASEAVAGEYLGRWSIEDTNRNAKQFLGGEHPQSWKGQGPERAAALSLWLYSAVWCWYIVTQGCNPTWPSLPWYRSKCTPSFLDALATLRRALWQRRIFARSDSPSLRRKILDGMVQALARAA